MNANAMGCRPNQFAAFLADELNDEKRARFEEHLSKCDECRRRLDEAIASKKEWDDLRASLSADTSFGDLPAANDHGCFDGGPDAEFCKKFLGPTDDPRMLGRIGSYEIVGMLGRGGMGIVFKAFDASLNRYVAIKVLAPMFAASGVSRQRFMREAQSAAAVVHEHVVPIHGIAKWQETPYLVMALVRGESLQKRLAQRGQLPIRELLRIGFQVAAGLGAAHAQGLIHRDIKPANILLESDIDRARITDFGLARAVDDIRLTRTDMLLGTPQYMSPEQARDEALDFRTDLFSLGVVLYEAATGRPPFQAATSYGILRKIVEQKPMPLRQLNSDVPWWFDDIVQKLMAKNPIDRYQNAVEVAALFQQCLAHVEQPNFVRLPIQLAPNMARRPLTLRRCAMMITSVAAASIASWLLLIGVADNSEKPMSDATATEQASSAASPVTTAAKERQGVMPTTTAGEYQITVRKTGDVGNMKMDVAFDLSKVSVNQQQTTSFNQGTSGGFAGGAGGGIGGKFTKPNFGIALGIHSKKKGDHSIVELSQQATATDDQGRKLEGKGDDPSQLHFPEFEASTSGEPVLYLSGKKLDAKSIAKLDGQLLVTPGYIATAAFDGPKFAIGKPKSDHGKSFTLKRVEQNEKGVEITALLPQTNALEKANDPQERFQALVASRGAYSAEIIDNRGDIHTPIGTGSAGGTASGQFSSTSSSVSSNIGGTQRFQSSGRTSSTNDYVFTFAPLPEGRDVKQIRLHLTERTGPAKTIPFTLENIRLDSNQ